MWRKRESRVKYTKDPDNALGSLAELFGINTVLVDRYGRKRLNSGSTTAEKRAMSMTYPLNGIEVCRHGVVELVRKGLNGDGERGF